MSRVQSACLVILLSIAAATSATAGDRKFTCVPTHELICVNMTLPLYKEGCQTEIGSPHTLSLTIDLDKEIVRLCYSSDGNCVDEKISVNEQFSPTVYITRNTDKYLPLQRFGVLNLENMTYGDTNIGIAAGNSLISSTDFFRCAPAL